MSLSLCPVTHAEVRAFIGQHHRHNLPPLQWRISVGIEDDGELVGVAVAGLPKARVLMQQSDRVLEVQRTCTDGTPNANSMLYGALARAGKALGYHRLYTYTLEEESGSSLRAAGWTVDRSVISDPSGWSNGTANHATYQVDLFGNERRPTGPKIRWLKELVA